MSLLKTLNPNDLINLDIGVPDTSLSVYSYTTTKNVNLTFTVVSIDNDIARGVRSYVLQMNDIQTHNYFSHNNFQKFVAVFRNTDPANGLLKCYPQNNNLSEASLKATIINTSRY